LAGPATQPVGLVRFCSAHGNLEVDRWDCDVAMGEVHILSVAPA
jgi:hypothetical protein